MTPVLSSLLRDLAEESADLDALVAEVPPDQWQTPTPAPGWTIAHQIAHLAWTDGIAHTAADDPAAFTAQVRELLAGSVDIAKYVSAIAGDWAETAPRQLLEDWRGGRARLAEALMRVPAGAKLPWLGPPMSAASMVTARLMETWAHGQDIADAVGVQRIPTVRLRHVASIGVRTRGFAFAVNNRQLPGSDVRVELVGPDGELWTWGELDAPDRVTGPALDFCLRVTQRCHRDDLALLAEGPIADEWLDIAQAFAGPPGPGRLPGRQA
ncbi:TIGR03084 family metal-binding protein [Nocardia sp. NPDC050175]|uniref:TIGR03084 family metal-binding protein n=1 Tax=Nocardia sp. NPDC050175 TaxID=3364317 RepID=UPI0037966084